MRPPNEPRRATDLPSDVSTILVRIVSAAAESDYWNVQPQKGRLNAPSDASGPTIRAYWPDGQTDPIIGSIMIAQRMHPSGEWELGARQCTDVAEA